MPEIRQSAIDNAIVLINNLTTEQLERVIKELNNIDLGGFAMFLDSTDKETYISLLYEDYVYVRDYIKVLKKISKNRK